MQFSKYSSRHPANGGEEGIWIFQSISQSRSWDMCRDMPGDYFAQDTILINWFSRPNITMQGDYLGATKGNFPIDNLYYSGRRLLNQKHPMPRETMVFANLANSPYWGQSSLCYIVYTLVDQYYGTILPIIIIIPPLFRYCVLTSHRLQIMTQTSICPAQCPSSVYNQRKKNAIIIFVEILFWGKLCVDYEFGKYRRPIKQSGEKEGSPRRSAESETQHLQ